MDFKDISWQVTEEEYRRDPALSYSILAKYERSGFNELNKLFDRIETPSLTFGSCVDSIITGGEKEFNERFIVCDVPSIPDTIVKIVKALFNLYGTTYDELDKIPTKDIIRITEEHKYQLNWKPETRAKVIIEKGAEYYDKLFLALGKTIITSEEYQKIRAAVDALKSSEATKWYFSEDNPFENVKRYYQLKFKGTIGGIDYRCMADEIIVDYDKKIIYPIDLKTSSHTEWDFYKSFVDWNYQIQARLYWRLIWQNIQQHDEFKDFKLENYRFIVVNKNTLTPLVWEFPYTKSAGTIECCGEKQSIMRDPTLIGNELNYYLTQKPTVPKGIELTKVNDLSKWLNKL